MKLTRLQKSLGNSTIATAINFLVGSLLKYVYSGDELYGLINAITWFNAFLFLGTWAWIIWDNQKYKNSTDNDEKT